MISHEEVKKAIDNLGRGKSSGLDDLVNEMFLDGRYILTPFLAKLFNYIFETISIHLNGQKVILYQYQRKET